MRKVSISIIVITMIMFLMGASNFDSEVTGTSTIRVPLGSNTYVISVLAYYAPVRVHAYNQVDHVATIVDSMYVSAGMSVPMWVSGYDSVQIIRAGATRVTWTLSKSKYITLAPAQVMSPGTSFDITHGDTITVDETYTYTQDQANKKTADHSGTCVYFESIALTLSSVRNNSTARITLKAWLDGHLIANGSIGANAPFATNMWRFDSFTVVADNFADADVASVSVGYNSRP